MEATGDVNGALTRVDRQLKIKHPQLSIEYKENSVDCKAFLHIWKPTDPSSQNLQGQKFLPCFHVVVSAEYDADSLDYNVIFQCFSYHGKLLEFDLTWLSTLSEFEFKSLTEMSLGSIQICKGINGIGENLDSQHFLVECYAEEIFVRSHDCTYMVRDHLKKAGSRPPRCENCSALDQRRKKTLPCPHCHKEIHERSLSRHIQAMHDTSDDSSVIECPVCKKKVHRDGIKKHLETSHRKSFKCLRCDKKVAATLTQISKHIQREHGVEVVKPSHYQVGLTEKDFLDLAEEHDSQLSTSGGHPRIPELQQQTKAEDTLDGDFDFLTSLSSSGACDDVKPSSGVAFKPEETSQNFIESEADFLEGNSGLAADDEETKYTDDMVDQSNHEVDEEDWSFVEEAADLIGSKRKRGRSGVSPPPPPLKKPPPSLRKKSGLKVTNVGGKLKSQWDAEKSRAPSFHCKICMKSYQTPIEVRDCVEAHKEGSNLEEPTKCTTCDETLLSRYVVTDHFSRKHRDLLFGQMCCPICMKMFPLKQNATTSLHAHVATNHGIKNVFCKICTKNMKSRGEEERHWKMHSKHGIDPDAIVRCPVCQRELKKQELNQHFKKLHSPDECVCTECFRMYDSAEKLRIHLLTCHHYHKRGEKKHVCTQCGQAFGSTKSLEGHINKVHKQIITNTCQECNKTFHHQHLYYAHMKNVHYARGLKCVHCLQVHQTRHSLYLHLITHSLLTPYSCLCCDFKSGKKSEVKDHFEATHQDLKFNQKYVGHDKAMLESIKETASKEADAAVKGISN